MIAAYQAEVQSTGLGRQKIDNFKPLPGWSRCVRTARFTLLCGYGKDCASALRGHGAHMMFDESVRRLLRSDEFLRDRLRWLHAHASVHGASPEFHTLRRRPVYNVLLTLKSSVNRSWGEITILGEQTNRCCPVPVSTGWEQDAQFLSSHERDGGCLSTSVVRSWVFLREWPFRCRPESKERQFGSPGFDRASFR